MIKYLKSLIICVFFSSIAYGQQLPYNQFFMNPYIYNPAYAGVEGHTVLFAMYKTQWSNIDGAPTMGHINFHVPLKGGLAFGAFAYNMSDGPLETNGGKITGGYLVTIDREHFLRFGLSIGGGNLAVNYDKIDDPTDPSLPVSHAFMLGDFGITYHFGHFNVGVSLPSLFGNTSLPSTNDFLPTSIKPTDQALLKINYRGHINDNIAIEPHLIYRYNKLLPDQWEITTILHVYHLVWIGGSYRQDAGAIGLLGAKIKEKMGIGYSYEFGNSKYTSQLGGSHEIHIGYHLGSKKEHAEHVSSFIKSHRLSAEERAQKAELERQRQLQALRESRAPKEDEKEDSDQLGLLGDQAPQVVDTDEPAKWNYEQEEILLERTNEFGEIEKGIKFDRINENGEKEVVFSWLPAPPENAQSETYELANPDEQPKERLRPDGTKEVGVKWVRTIDDGPKQILVVWDPVLTEEEADQIDHSPSQTLGLGAAKIVIRKEEPQETEEIEENEQEQVVVETTVPADKIEIEENLPEVTQEEEKQVEEEETGSIEEIDQPEAIEDDSVAIVEQEETKEVITIPYTSREGHLLELPKGYYVIADSYEDFMDAENESDKIFNWGYYDTRIGYLSSTSKYYVVVSKHENEASAQQDKQRVSKASGLRKLWVLKVGEE